jgi:enoyl-CoA hydratase/carnithine racemase
MTEHVLTELDGGVLMVRFNRPEKRNALTPDMYSALADAIDRANLDTGIRVVLFTGNGGVFTAGNDVSDFLDSPPAGSDSPVYRFINRMVTTDVPLMAAVDGFAVGIGTTMLLHFDQVFASHEARFSLPFINLALLPEAGSSQLLVEACGYKKAAELLMLGEPFSARVALDCGIVSHLSSPESLQEDALSMARKLAAKPGSALRATKRLMRRSREPLRDRVLAEGKLFAQQLQSGEAREALSAFLEKRAPDFSKFS